MQLLPWRKVQNLSFVCFVTSWQLLDECAGVELYYAVLFTQQIEYFS